MKLHIGKEAKTIEFKYGDVVLLVKTEATEGDRMVAVFHSYGKGDPQTAAKRVAYCREAARCMVVGWKNVQDDKGQDLPFDFDLLETFPQIAGHSLFIELGGFIHEKTDFGGVKQEAKNA